MRVWNFGVLGSFGWEVVGGSIPSLPDELVLRLNPGIFVELQDGDELVFDVVGEGGVGH